MESPKQHLILSRDKIAIIFTTYYHFIGSLLFLNGQKQFKLRRQLLFTIKPVRKVYPADTTVRMNSHSQSFDVITTISPACKIRQIELDLIPTLIQSHRHSTDKRLHSSSRLIVAGSKSPAYILIVEYLNFESKIFFELIVPIGTFLIIMTKKGSLIPRVSASFCGQVMKAVVTLVPIIYRTED